MTQQEDPDLAGSESKEQDAESLDDVALRPGPNADAAADVERYISAEVRALYDVYSYRHAAAILANSFPEELQQIERALLDFRITVKDIGTPGGNESDMPKKFSRTLRPAGWVETRIQGDLLVRMQEYDELFAADGKAPEGQALREHAAHDRELHRRPQDRLREGSRRV